MRVGINDVIVNWKNNRCKKKKVIAVRRLQSSRLPSRFPAVACLCLNSRLNLPACVGSLHAKNIRRQHFFVTLGFTGEWIALLSLHCLEDIKKWRRAFSRCLCTGDHRSHAPSTPLGRMKISVFIRPFNAITSKKGWVTYDNESFDPRGSSVYWRFDRAASDIS